jgi:transglutaminase-like putative cysteine protease
VEAAKAQNQISSESPRAGFPGAKLADAKNIQKTPITQKDLDLAADKLDRRFNDLEKTLAEIPRESFDPQALIDKVGADPIKLFEWIRDTTSLVPYRGILRGVRGVLLDRLGNSLDRALLLQNLLKRSGHEVRLARGKLSGNQARELLAEWPFEKRTTPSSSENRVSDLQNRMGELAAQYQLDPSVLARLNEAIKDYEILSNTLSATVKQQTKEIMDILKREKETRGDQDQTSLAKAVQDHWWVQLYQEEKWIDLDPAIPHGNPGTRLTELENMLQPEDIDKGLFHQVTIRVIIERRAKGVLEEKTTLEHTFRPCDLYGQQISFQNAPMNWPQDFDPSKEKDPLKKMIEIIAAENEWLPIVRVENETFSQASFTDRGEVQKNPGKGRKTGGVANIAGGIFGVLAGKEEESEIPSDSILTAEWVEFEIKTPGAEPRISRRSVFDLIGPAARSKNRLGETGITSSQRVQRALAMLGETGILIQSCNYTPEFLAEWTVQRLLKNRDILPNYIRRLSQMKGLGEMANRLTRLPGPEHTFGLFRSHLAAEKPNFYLDRPNIACLRTDLRQSEDGNVVTAAGFDIVFNGISAFRSRDIDSFKANVAQGILDTNLEAIMLRAPDRVYNNTAELFAQSRLQSINWKLVRSPEDAVIKKLAISEDTKERLAKELRDGNIAILPPTSLNLGGNGYFGWWRIDPATGETLGISESGRGGSQTMLEYLEALGLVFGTFNCITSVLSSGVSEKWGCDLARFMLCGTGISFTSAFVTFLIREMVVIQAFAICAVFSMELEKFLEKYCY